MHPRFAVVIILAVGRDLGTARGCVGHKLAVIRADGNAIQFGMSWHREIRLARLKEFSLSVILPAPAPRRFLNERRGVLGFPRAGMPLRGLSEGKYNSNWITCTTACPVSTANNITSNYNTLPSAWYLDFSSSYDVSTGVNAYFNVKNLFNVNPPVFYPGPNSNAWQTIPAPLFNYDIEGRVYRVGVRFKY